MLNQVVSTDVLCPKCGSQTYRWGHAANHKNLQRYRCKNSNCRHQFIPGRPKHLKKYPTMPCPKCGGKMSIFKFLSDGYRLRCNNHIYKDERHCSHKVNVPLPGKSFKIAKDPLECIDVSIAVKFSLPTGRQAGLKCLSLKLPSHLPSILHNLDNCLQLKFRKSLPIFLMLISPTTASLVGGIKLL